jgi:hypothetical protein
MEQAHGIIFSIVGAEGIGADELGAAIGLMGGGAFDAAHFMEDHGHARICALPSGFAASQSSPYNVYGFVCHFEGIPNKTRNNIQTILSFSGILGKRLYNRTNGYG